MTKLKQQINPSVDSNAASYFHRKFYTQENALSYNRIAQQGQISFDQANQFNCKLLANLVVRTVLSGKPFFDMQSPRKVFCHFAPKTHELFVVDISNPHAPRIADVACSDIRLKNYGATS